MGSDFQVKCQQLLNRALIISNYSFIKEVTMQIWVDTCTSS